MATLEVNNKQLQLIQRALDLYSRIGAGQFEVIKEHPTFERHLANECRPIKEPEVGDRTSQGEILEIKKGKALINGSVKNGVWDKSTEWKKLSDVKLSTDYGKYHNIRSSVDTMLVQPRNMLMQELNYPQNSNWGIHNPKVNESCREAYDLIQVIRHELWKENENRSSITVDSSIHFTSKDSNNIKVTL